MILEYSNGTSAIIDLGNHLEDLNIIEFDSDRLGYQWIYFTYKNSSYVGFDIQVVSEDTYQKLVSHIEIVKKPLVDEVEYNYVEYYESLEVNLVYITGVKQSFIYSEIIADSNFYFEVTYDQIYLTYSLSIEGSSQRVSTSIGVKYILIENIYLVTNPDKLVYKVRESIDLTGLVIIVTDQDNNEKTIVYGPDALGFVIEGYDRRQLGEQYITIYYRGYLITSFYIEVVTQEDNT